MTIWLNIFFGWIVKRALQKRERCINHGAARDCSERLYVSCGIDHINGYGGVGTLIKLFLASGYHRKITSFFISFSLYICFYIYDRGMFKDITKRFQRKQSILIQEWVQKGLLCNCLCKDIFNNKYQVYDKEVVNCRNQWQSLYTVTNDIDYQLIFISV